MVVELVVKRKGYMKEIFLGGGEDNNHYRCDMTQHTYTFE